MSELEDGRVLTQLVSKADTAVTAMKELITPKKSKENNKPLSVWLNQNKTSHTRTPMTKRVPNGSSSSVKLTQRNKGPSYAFIVGNKQKGTIFRWKLQNSFCHP